MADSGGASIGRRRLLISSVLLGIGVLVAGLLVVGVPTAGTASRPAWADPEGTFKPPDDCGKQTDSTTAPRMELWKAVKDHNPPPANPSPNIFVDESWALKNGGQGTHDLLAIPRARVTGVECPEIWGPKAFNLWKPAWEEAVKRFPSNFDIMLGINSMHGRKQDQLHIHLTGFQPTARTQLNGLGIPPTKVTDWNSPKTRHVIMGHVYRIVWVNGLDTNVFQLVKENISQNDMFQQAIAVVSAAPNKGFYILNTQGKPDPGEPEHNPELHLGKDFGTEAIDDLISRS